MIDLDVLIVGGGPAGSSVAWGLRDCGLDVAVMDSRAFPRHKVCAGWITPAVVAELGIDIDDYARTRVLQPIHGFRIGQMGHGVVRTHRSETALSYGILRAEFDQHLLERSDARLLLGQPVRTIERDARGWRINGEIRARLLVGAGGHFCPVARQMGATPGKAETTVLAQEVEFEMTAEQRSSCRVEPTVPELYFCADLGGYGWVFRKGDHLNVGLGREGRAVLSEEVPAFLRLLISEGRIPRDTPDKFRGHAYLLYPRSTREFLDDGCMLVGDAAGLAYPESGEGIRPAVESGLLAARIAEQAEGDYRQAKLQPYRKMMTSRFGARRLSRGRPALLPTGLRNALVAKLLATEWFARNIVVNRWFLRVHQPGLAREFRAAG